ncbi:MAG: 16S rRNA (uracil(1498)-N(3))-methyltransferase [Lachnospiraceae bacterium]|nr:16S rRNA (uracil(1498)-N(3))-methyltransferase [Lachnospiraceae bacterium]
MYQFFTDPGNICGKDIYIEGRDYNHIRNVLRLRIGEEVSVIASDKDDGSEGTVTTVPGVADARSAMDSTMCGNKEYRCEIADYEDDRVHLKLRFVKEDNVELPNRIYLFQGLPKSDKMELIIQKAVELGAYEIIPVQMARSVVKYDKKKEAAKITRFNGISEAAAKQSKRRIIPEVKPVMSFKEAVEYSKDMDLKLLPYELADMDSMDKTRNALGSIKPGQDIAVFIGPEGGFDEPEVSLAVDAGFKAITLGRRILRTETAGMTVMSWLVYICEQS